MTNPGGDSCETPASDSSSSSEPSVEPVTSVPADRAVAAAPTEQVAQPQHAGPPAPPAAAEPTTAVGRPCRRPPTAPTSYAVGVRHHHRQLRAIAARGLPTGLPAAGYPPPPRAASGYPAGAQPATRRPTRTRPNRYGARPSAIRRRRTAPRRLSPPPPAYPGWTPGVRRRLRAAAAGDQPAGHRSLVASLVGILCAHRIARRHRARRHRAQPDQGEAARAATDWRSPASRSVSRR